MNTTTQSLGLSVHLAGTLVRLSSGSQVGYHFGSLKALVARGLATTRRGALGTEYVITDAGKIAVGEVAR